MVPSPLKFGQNGISKSWDIPDMDKCRQDKCCLDKCHSDSVFAEFPRLEVAEKFVGVGGGVVQAKFRVQL